jgi:shikimate dehydrogenase
MGHNTDWSGFAASMRAGLPDAEMRRVAQLGAGGAGAATAYALLKLGTRELRLYDVDTVRATALVDKLHRLFPDRDITMQADAAVALRGADGLVQTTPVGMVGHPGIAIAPRLLDPRLWVTDIIYTPPETELLARARQLGCRAINGSGMVVSQAADAFRLFTGIAPDLERMRRSLETAGGSA